MHGACACRNVSEDACPHALAGGRAASVGHRSHIPFRHTLTGGCCLSRYVLQDAGPDALVLVDELGKGTEVHGGTAIAAVLLERLSLDGCRGIFATCAPRPPQCPAHACSEGRARN